ncbi:TonB-dependent siderophore receptor [Cylindrospermum stagnale]|nr:TonB-dependent siderophore receptor [Cylindrospermum stagnale]
MKVEKLVQSLLVTGSVVMVATTPAKSEEIPVQSVQNTDTSISNQQISALSSSTQELATNKKIPRLDKIGHLPKSAEMLVQKPTSSGASSQELVQITEVKLNTTEKGFELILVTSKGEQLQLAPKKDGKTYFVDISQAQLKTPFRQEKPVAGITEVTVTNLDAKTIRLKVIAETDLPKVDLFDDDQGLIFDFIPVTSSAQSQPQPQTQPASTAELVQVTGVKLNNTEKGLEIILETPKGEQLQITPKTEGNTYIADIAKAQLNTPFNQENPIAGITEVTVTNLDANTIRLKVITEADAPQVELFDDAEGLVFNLIPVASSTEPPQTQPTPPSTQSESEAQPEQPTAEAETPIELVVTGEQDKYRVIDATTATRTDTALRDTPQSIQVVPQQVLKDQQVLKLNDAVRNVSGVSSGDSFAGTRDGFVIRGFSSSFGGNILTNGLGSNGFTSGFNETANLERVEVLKGPASVLYGNLEPGGVINLVTKKPLFQPFYAAELQIGNNSFYRGAIDISNPLNIDKTASYRLNAAYENSGTFRNFDQRIERTFFTPVVSLQIGKQTDLTLEFSYLNDERPFDRGLIAIGNKVVDTPYNRIFGEPDDVSKLEEISASYQLEHRFNENLKLRNTFRFLSSDTFDYRADPQVLNAETGELQRNFRSNDDIARRYALQTDLTSKFKTGAVDHTLLFGVDFSRNTSEGTQSRLPAGLTPSINIFNPIYNQTARPGLSELTNVVRNNEDSANSLGFFLQDQIALANNLKLVLGGRFDFADQESKDNTSDTTSNQYNEAFSPRVGIVYQPTQPISLYASYSESFQPNFATKVDGSFLKPERGRQYEAGIRGEFLNNRLVTNLAAYQITKSNVATTDINNPDFSVAIGEQQSSGIELDVAGQILPGWNVIASYSYTDAKVTASNEGLKNNRLSNVPYNAASLWTTYELQKGNLQGLGFGIGMFFVGERQGDLGNTFQVPSYVRTDAAIFYRRNNWKAGLNFKNLFDVQYIRASEYREAITPGDPFTVVGSISVEF